MALLSPRSAVALGWTNHYAWWSSYLRSRSDVKKVYSSRLQHDFTWDGSLIESSDLDTRSTCLPPSTNKKQEGKYHRAYRNVTEGGWYKVVIYPQPVYPSFARLPDNNNVTSLSHLFFSPKSLVQLTWPHIAGSADSVNSKQPKWRQ